MIRVAVDDAKERLAELIESALGGVDVYIEVGNEDDKRTIRLTS